MLENNILKESIYLLQLIYFSEMATKWSISPAMKKRCKIYLELLLQVNYNQIRVKGFLQTSTSFISLH